MSLTSRLFGRALPRQIGDLSGLAALAVVDAAGRIIWSNAAFAGLAGQSAVSLLPLLGSGTQEAAAALATSVSSQVSVTLNGHSVTLRLAAQANRQRLVTVETAAPAAAI